MRLFSTMTLALAWIVSALAEPKVTFINQDNKHRTIVFTPSVPHKEIKPLRVPAHQEVTQPFPHGWIGNWWSVTDGKPWIPGMLGEVTFNGYMGLTFFDVSAIANDRDTSGVKMMWPRKSASVTSGCDVFSCGNEYTYPDEVQTKATDEDHLMCSLGDGVSPVYPRGAKKWKKEARRQGEEEKVVVVKPSSKPKPSAVPTTPAKEQEQQGFSSGGENTYNGDNDNLYRYRRHRYYRPGNLGE
ncbi:uncharacterized protein PODANS_2_10640 [Podospora anserina S mat+]|uniref:Podospora anserina S mat+ genomic DNA chromosome 2, supercontig 2 n=1 Tax=Podospora anserina (strain S / ATCC MYA-4624 / DSM 980 / FGSC 10383) TaxID=515849 RepID=B2B7C5_PODAN|nr:uncharacterized protein PODANS_2_10640 [Podospora anserina S mat+]CAP73703.1 unnamed protein product [Podospora anserina S mat+]CDP26105.1 Putative protein of unknown function [Podospora anserina S mat+]